MKQQTKRMLWQAASDYVSAMDRDGLKRGVPGWVIFHQSDVFGGESNGFAGPPAKTTRQGLKPVGWVSTLDAPEKWEPGVFAVPPDGGQIFVAIGGDHYNGAKVWDKYLG